MTNRERIIEIATQLFIQHGVKSVTIDRIVKELHTSKRTLYNHFTDKTELLRACLAVYHKRIKAENEAAIEASDNAIEAMARIHQQIVRRASVVNPNFFNDILHYYPNMLHESYRNNGNFAHAQVENLGNWGINDGIFVKDIDMEIVTKMVLLLLDLLKDNNRFPIDKYSKERLTFAILVPYMRGLCTDKGRKLLEMQEELFRVTL